MSIRDSSFGELFGTAFAVGAAFQVVLFAAGLLMAVLNPSLFYTGAPGAQVAASSPSQAIGVLVLMTLMMLLVNLVVSSAGAGVLVLARSARLFRKKAQP